MTEPKAVDLKGGGKEGHRLGVDRQGDRIVFDPSWACSAGRRTFSLAHALELVDAIELTGELDAWYASHDDGGARYAVKLVDGRLYCDEEPRDDVEDGEVPRAPNFSWRDFQRSVKARAKTLKPQAS
jgi:hypothetical protein